MALGSDANFSTTVATSIGNKVPYTGATGGVDLGVYGLTAISLYLKKNGTNGSNIIWDTTSGQSIASTGQTSIGPVGTDGFGVYFEGATKAFYFSATNITAQRIYTMPNASGTIALTSNLSSYVPYTGATANVDLGTRLLLAENVIINTANYITPIDLVAINSGGTVARVSVSNVLAHLGISPSSYVPYTGATADINTGNFSIYSNYLNLKNALYLNGDTYNGAIVMTSNKGGQIYATTNSINISPAGIYLLDFTFGGATGGAANLKNFRLDVTPLTLNQLRTYTMPDASGTLALTSNLSSYVPTTRTITINGTALNLSEDRAWTITTASTYTLPTASTTVLGGIKVGTNLSIDANGVLSSTDTNTTYSAFTGATALANGSSGLVTAPVIADRVKYLKGDGTWGTPTDTDTTYVAFTGSTTLADGAAGLVPKPVIANRLQYLRGDGTWATPPDTDTDTNTVTQIRRENADGTTSATAYRTGDIRLRQGANVTITEVSAGIFQIASSYVDTDTNTWNANTKTVAGYVAAPGDVANKVWKTDATGNPGWRDDADTDTNTTYTAGTGLTLTGTVFSVTKTITAVETADTIALRNGSGQLVATGFYQASSRELKTNINPFTRSALDIIRDVTVVSFNYKTDVINKHIGFIAEDTPEELSTRNKNVMDANNTIGVLLKAVQELEARIKQLESK